MTREEAKQAAMIMLAYAEGKDIQFNNASGEWVDIPQDEEPDFDWFGRDYRVQPKKTYRPFKNADEAKETKEFFRNIITKARNKVLFG